MLGCIRINQLEIYQRGLHDQTDAVDWIIIQYLRWIESNTKRIHTNGSYYHRVHLPKMIHGLPMSGLKTESGMCKRLQHLAQLRLVSFFRTNNNQLYFRLGYTARQIMELAEEDVETTYCEGVV